MEDNFENELKKHGDAYKVVPREWVWPRVEAELDKKKERRIAAWWWMAPLFLLMLGGGYLIIGNKETNNDSTVSLTVPNLAVEKTDDSAATIESSEKNEKSSTISLTEKSTATSESPSKENTTASQKITTSDKTKPQIAKAESATNSTALTAKKSLRITVKHSVVQSKSGHISQTDLSSLNPTNKLEKDVDKKVIVDKELATEAAEKETILGNGKQANATQALTDVSAKKTTVEEPVLITEALDSINAKTAEKNIAKIQTDSAEVNKETTKKIGVPSIAINPKKSFKREVVWTINVGAGITNNKNGVGLSQLFNSAEKMYADNIQSGTNSGGCTSCNVITGPILSNKSSLNLNLSLERSQWIGKRWKWQVEAGWQYQQMYQRTGDKKDSAIYYASFNNLAYGSFYQSGSTVTSKGCNHRLFISSQIAFALLKNKKLLLSAGLYTGVNIGNNYLIPDKTNWRFIDGKTLYNDWFLGGEAGLKYVLKNDWSIGLNGKVDFTRSFTPPDGNNQYWKGWQIQAGIPVSTIKHLFKK